jgi:hypothetical protein
MAARKNSNNIIAAGEYIDRPRDFFWHWHALTVNFVWICRCRTVIEAMVVFVVINDDDDDDDKDVPPRMVVF